MTRTSCISPTIIAARPSAACPAARAGAVFNHEWRDQANPYRTGPLIWIENGKLRAADQEVTEIPTGEWVRFEVRAGLGRKADGTWTLTVYPPGKPPVHKTGLPWCESLESRSTGWGSSARPTTRRRFTSMISRSSTSPRMVATISG